MSSKELFFTIFFGLILFVKIIILFQTKEARALIKRPVLLFCYFIWIGTEPENFLKKHIFTKSDASLIFQGLGAIVFGWLIRLAVQKYVLELDDLAGYLAVVSLIYIFIFGYSNLFCGLFRLFEIGIEVPFGDVFETQSLRDFWGHRWSRPFVNAAKRLFYKPLKRYLPRRSLQFSVFLISGIFHDMFMSLPVDAGYGKCTAYFLIQGLAVIFEEQFLKKYFDRHSGWGGVWAFSVILVPLPLLFHWDFREFVLSQFIF